MEGGRDLHDTDIEIGGVDDLHGVFLGLLIVGEVVLLDMVVEGLGSEFGM